MPQDHCSTEVPKDSGNPNPTASTPNPPANHMETLTVETSIPTMDVKSAFLYGTIDEEVYVMQPLGFQDPEFLAKVYKVEKAIKQREDFILVQVYVDDIIFVSSNPQLCREFEALMHDKFQMSSMGELNFFLGLQVLQKEDGIFLSQDKYVGDILKKFGFTYVRSSNTPMDKENPWGKDGTGKDVDLHLYRSMIGSLMYLTASRPNIITDVPEDSGNLNPTASTPNPPADRVETLTVETPIPTVSLPVPTAYSTDSQEPSSDARLISKRVANQEEIPSLDNILSLTNWFEDILGGITNSDESNGEEADMSNIETAITASPTPTYRIHKDNPKCQIISPVNTLIQTRNKSKEVGEHSFIATIHQKTYPALLQFYLFSCFLSQVEPKKIFDALQDPSWVKAMQKELLQFKIHNVWTLVDCPKWVRPIGTKWILKNKKDERGIVIRNKARLVAQGHTKEEGMDYDEAPRAWYGTLSKYLLKNGFQRESPFDLVAFSDSDYGGTTQDGKSTTGGC
nr:hypothetical protein [Tanacetum cinerariifolium]